jgi:hypothetical protein
MTDEANVNYSPSDEPIITIVMEPEPAPTTPTTIPAQVLPLLSEEVRASIFSELMREESYKQAPIGIDKQSYKDVVDAVDVWISENMMQVENKIPQPGRSSLTMEQKARIFFAVTKAKLGIN